MTEPPLTILRSGERYERTTIQRQFGLGSLDARVFIGRDGAAVLLGEATELLGDSDEYDFRGEWPALGESALTGSNLAVIEFSPNLHLFAHDGDSYIYRGRFGCVGQQSRLLSRDGLATRGIVFRLVRAESSNRHAAADGGELRLDEVSTLGPIQLVAGAFEAETDPAQRRLLLEKALGGHRALIKDLVQALRQDPSARCYEDARSYDLLVRWPDIDLLVEAKTMEGDSVSRVRLGLSQLLEYSYRLHVGHGISASLALAFDRPLEGPPWLEPFLEADREITLIWRAPNGFIARGPVAAILEARSNDFDNAAS